MRDLWREAWASDPHPLLTLAVTFGVLLPVAYLALVVYAGMQP